MKDSRAFSLHKKLTNRPKVTKVESNTHAAANYDPALGKSSFILDILQNILPKSSQVKKVANPIKSFVTLPRTSIHSRAFSSKWKVYQSV